MAYDSRSAASDSLTDACIRPSAASMRATKHMADKDSRRRASGGRGLISSTVATPAPRASNACMHDCVTITAGMARRQSQFGAAAGSLIASVGGLKPIEQLRPGERLLSCDPYDSSLTWTTAAEVVPLGADHVHAALAGDSEVHCVRRQALLLYDRRKPRVLRYYYGKASAARGSVEAVTVDRGMAGARDLVKDGRDREVGCLRICHLVHDRLSPLAETWAVRTVDGPDNYVCGGFVLRSAETLGPTPASPQQ